FVASGDVSVKVIGSEAQMPDCEVPVRVMLEQLVAKLGIPPFLLGISWSSTERMSAQQADILTSELEYYRAAVEPVIRRVLTTHLRLAGLHGGFDIEWNDINLQDAVELSQARLNNARALQIEKEYGLEGNDDF
ncbi:MAG: serine/threonine protein phosphatase, partial [Ruminococcus sp.]|nr:serine/threonine protein phosphatase [Ruminococcus sp.]